MNGLELKVPPLLLALVLAVAMWLSATQLPSLALTLPWRQGLAITVAGVGLLFVLAAGYAFRKVKTTINPTKPGAASSVVVTGVYRISRNPMYVGALLALAGWALYLSHPLPVLFLPAFVAYMNRFQISPEERALSAKFGTEYETYRHAVRRWL